jgi:hypothetical protein
VDAVLIVEVQLDGGRPMRLEKLLELKPWAQAGRLRHQRSGLIAESANGSGSGSGNRLSSDAGAPAAASSGGGTQSGQGSGSGSGAEGKKKSKGRRSFQRVSFLVKVAAVVSAEEPRQLPDVLLQWAVKVGLAPRPACPPRQRNRVAASCVAF